MPEQSAGISIVITVRNEARNLRELFSSLMGQSRPFEVVLVDSGSTDDTPLIVKEFGKSMPIRHMVRKCTRGEGRNIGVENSNYDSIVFTDGDVTVSNDFVGSYRNLFAQGFDLIAGEIVPSGVEKFKLERVKLIYSGFEITRPSANLGYAKELFVRLEGFDRSFVTAEDIDLNLRAVKSGARHTICSDCIVYNKTRSNYSEFARQAFWNGYGRRQLKRKNRAIWDSIEKMPKIGQGALMPHLVRLGFGSLGYIFAAIKN